MNDENANPKKKSILEAKFELTTWTNALLHASNVNAALSVPSEAASSAKGKRLQTD
jgi:hypothetical protein